MMTKIKPIGGRAVEQIHTLTPEQFLPLVVPWDSTVKSKDIPNFDFTHEGIPLRVLRSSLRYDVFKQSLKCACCGLEGTVFSLDWIKSSPKNAHFNLYAMVGDDHVLMTKDHIRPVAQGGKNFLENLQTMCCKCNTAKRSRYLVIEELRKDPAVQHWIQYLNERNAQFAQDRFPDAGKSSPS